MFEAPQWENCCSEITQNGLKLTMIVTLTCSVLCEPRRTSLHELQHRKKPVVSFHFNPVSSMQNNKSSGTSLGRNRRFTDATTQNLEALVDLPANLIENVTHIRWLKSQSENIKLLHYFDQTIRCDSESFAAASPHWWKSILPSQALLNRSRRVSTASSKNQQRRETEFLSVFFYFALLPTAADV